LHRCNSRQRFDNRVLRSASPPARSSTMISPSPHGMVSLYRPSRPPVYGLFFFIPPLTATTQPRPDSAVGSSSAPAAASCRRRRTARGPCRGCCRRTAAVAVLGPQLDLEEIAPVGDQGIVGLLAEEIVGPSRRLAQPASLNGSLLRSKRDRKIAGLNLRLLHPWRGERGS
jgi:hypothetical protein